MGAPSLVVVSRPIDRNRKLSQKRYGGRPKLPPEIVRDQRVVTFLTKDERKRLENVADGASVSVSRACHDLILGGLERMDPPEDPGVRKRK